MSGMRSVPLRFGSRKPPLLPPLPKGENSLHMHVKICRAMPSVKRKSAFVNAFL